MPFVPAIWVQRLTLARGGILIPMCRESADRRVGTLAAAVGLFALACCGGSPAAPSRPGITLGVPSTITGKYVSCAACDAPLVLVADFPVVVGDPGGPGGTVERVEIVAVDASRGTELARNVRPNADVAYPVTAVPGGGSVTLTAGVVISPAPPPKDAVTVSVTVRLTDARASTASAVLTVADPDVTAVVGSGGSARD